MQGGEAGSRIHRPTTAINDLQKVARTAYEAEAEFTRLTKDNERWRRNLAAADGEIDNSEADLEQLLLQSGIANATQVPEAIEKSKRKAELSKSIAENKRALTQAAGSTPLDTFLNDIEAASPDARSMELRELEQRIERLENDKAEKMREQERIQNEFRLREDASAVSEASCEKYSAAARIDLLLAEYVRNYIAAELLRKAVALYSDKHQDPLLRSAGEYFKELTCGAFSGILIEQGRNGRGLKAERQNGVRMSIERLSDGTRDQLFLALRLAYIENHCAQNESCPVIFDDVLMAFDDQRAAAALRALRRLSERAQVLLFTHHQHHVKLAEEILGPAFQLHELISKVSLAA